MKEHELDQFMTALENAGILTGWSKFIGNDGPKDDLSESEQKETLEEKRMLNCSKCKHAVKVAEHEFECTADQYDIDNKTCFVPQNLSDADETAFRDINRISVNADMLSELLT